MLSYWEKKHFLAYDYIIIGSGITGLSTAISLHEKNAHARILVLERGLLPTGASTKNAGFACIGSLTEVLADLKVMHTEEVLKLVSLRLKGLQLLRSRLGGQTIHYHENGSYELVMPHEAECLNSMDNINELLLPVIGQKAFSVADGQISSFKFNGVKHLIKNNAEGELDTGAMMQGLLALCRQMNIEVKTGCEVLQLLEEETGVHVQCKAETGNEPVSFKAKHVGVCTNAFSKRFFPDKHIEPGRGLVLITKPIAQIPFKGIFHFDEGYYYFRKVDDRVLFGGGRNKDLAGERTTEFRINPFIQTDLLEKLSTVILPDTPFEIDYWWSGIMAFGNSKMPVIESVSERIHAAVRMGGMGVAIGSEAGRQLSALMIAD